MWWHVMKVAFLVAPLTRQPCFSWKLRVQTDKETVINQQPSSAAVQTKEVTLKTVKDRAAYARQAKARVLDLIPKLSDDQAGHERLKILLDGLTAVHAYNPIMTKGFLGLALGGTWRLAYTTATQRKGSARMRIVDIVQTITPESESFLEEEPPPSPGSSGYAEREESSQRGGGRLKTFLEWSFAEEAAGAAEAANEPAVVKATREGGAHDLGERGPARADEDFGWNGVSAESSGSGVAGGNTALVLSRGVFSVSSSYSVDSKGNLALRFSEDGEDGGGGGGYELSPGVNSLGESFDADEAHAATKLGDPLALCALLERACPRDLFAPDAVALKTTYVDEDLRVVETSGGPALQGETVRAVFVRV
mmetsp:Transcript_14084/g.28901  ORF Transcript_14084/g.28901 Transcript_14084/m.28901 type:complete len:365 (-) Transcript_14084:312-1406(-)